jgi:hypothetical protein
MIALSLIASDRIHFCEPIGRIASREVRKITAVRNAPSFQFSEFEEST